MSPVAIKQLLFAIEAIPSVMRGKSVKPTVTPDSVHAGLPLHVTTINLGPGSPQGLGATYPPTPGAPVRTLRRTAALCVGLLGIAARRDCPFHLWARAATCVASASKTRLCCSDPHLMPCPCGRGFRWTAVSCYAALRSPDVPPVLCFQNCTSGGLVGFTPRLSARRISI